MAWPLHYPGDVPADSFLFTGASFEPMADPPSNTGRTALVACGSNASPERLMAKFAGSTIDPTMPVVRATVQELASVYSRHISRYGAIPATAMRRPGARSELFVQFVDDEQLALIARSEQRSYRLVELDPLVHRVTLRSGAVVDRAWCFASTFGALVLDGAPIGLATFPTEGLAAMTHAALWAALGRRWRRPADRLPIDPIQILAALAADADDAHAIRAAFAALTIEQPLDLATVEPRTTVSPR